MEKRELDAGYVYLNGDRVKEEKIPDYMKGIRRGEWNCLVKPFNNPKEITVWIKKQMDNSSIIDPESAKVSIANANYSNGSYHWVYITFKNLFKE